MKNRVAPPHRWPSTRPKPNVMTACSAIALTGVFSLGCTFESAFGSEPERAIENHMRVEAFIVAIETATAELISASIASHHSGPQNSLASVNGISSDEPTRPLTSCVPQPRIRPQEQMAKN